MKFLCNSVESFLGVLPRYLLSRSSSIILADPILILMVHARAVDEQVILIARKKRRRHFRTAVENDRFFTVIQFVRHPFDGLLTSQFYLGASEHCSALLKVLEQLCLLCFVFTGARISSSWTSDSRPLHLPYSRPSSLLQNFQNQLCIVHSLTLPWPHTSSLMFQDVCFALRPSLNS